MWLCCVIALSDHLRPWVVPKLPPQAPAAAWNPLCLASYSHLTSLASLLSPPRHTPNASGLAVLLMWHIHSCLLWNSTPSNTNTVYVLTTCVPWNDSIFPHFLYLNGCLILVHTHTKKSTTTESAPNMKASKDTESCGSTILKRHSDSAEYNY